MLVALLGLAATGQAAFARADGPNLVVNEAPIITLHATTWGKQGPQTHHPSAIRWRLSCTIVVRAVDRS